MGKIEGVYGLKLQASPTPLPSKRGQNFIAPMAGDAKDGAASQISVWGEARCCPVLRKM
jgi:hypothetical protein